MSDHRFYLSVMSPAASSGSLTFQLDTFDADFNLQGLVATVTGITAGMAETDVAIQIQNQLATQFPVYSGAPRFSAEAYAATFRVTRTEHCVCIWSQAQFRLQLTSDTVGCNLTMADVPLLATCNRLLYLYGGFAGGVVNGFANLAGYTLTTSQLIALIEAISSEVIGYLNNHVVISTYLGEWRTDGVKSVFTSPTPGLSIDQPVIRRKNLYEMYSIPQYSQLAYNWIRHTGQLTFRFNQNFINAGEPFELDNEVRVSFVAGEFVIPTAIQRCMLELAKFGLNSNSGLDEIGGGSFRARFRKYSENLEHYFRPIRQYRCKRMR